MSPEETRIAIGIAFIAGVFTRTLLRAIARGLARRSARRTSSASKFAARPDARDVMQRFSNAQRK